MGKKAEPGTAKAIANKIKSKGLKKVRFYCQMCEKQCRDENGFKCHKMSEGHQRKMQVFMSNSRKFTNDFSKQFETGFLDILSRRHNTNKVSANYVYNEYIQDKQHVHMNATRWTSLTEFVLDLAKRKVIIITGSDHRGSIIQWVSRDPDVIRQQQHRSNKRKIREEIDDEGRRQKMVEMQVRASTISLVTTETSATKLDEDSQKDLGKLSLNIQKGSNSKSKKRKIGDEDGDAFAEEEAEEDDEGDVEEEVEEHKTSKAAAKIVNTEERKQSETKFTWLVDDLVVKIVSKKVGSGNYVNRKGVVLAVRNSSSSSKFKAELQMTDRLDDSVTAKESHLETVLPGIGQSVMIVSAYPSFPHRGSIAKLMSIDEKAFKAHVQLATGEKLALDYENICKIFQN